ncbi:hypothetical protein CLV52_0993 [Amnibacterium kyonggiense]|uniref:Uncharacterized protein n=2 Tax=Amnibacterium kyonggiense TaxID=595671 RepID=A0A4R7FRJ0_9MICO|nr:hypothetical protein CLV52_0993 [Amnibacterium kyonggiense]
MSFEVMFDIGVVVVAAGFVTVIGLVIYRAVRSARDPEYRAALAAQSAAVRTRSSSIGLSSTMGTQYDPASDPGNPGSPMFPGNPGNPT